MRVFVLFSPAVYEGETGIIYGVFSSKEEAEKHKLSYTEIQEHTMDTYFGDDIEYYY
ncbi:hypothetical protein HCA78_17300 [Listeria booriae]|uniref:Uncharacterized protein n=1 Tax=Listeria booriae TaxID=1552123 RepID=A0A842CTF9_9LIST|nr:hypothetical protein [Listeria booriae]MBC2005528.1 hypothetical protein [Listeria booriae]MBC2048219.1 hypothetical protein [Listeria booriae]